MSQVTTHILNTSLGRPAAGVCIVLYREHDDDWQEIGRGHTNADGRLPALLPDHELQPPGTYKLRFHTKPYFDQLDIKTFYPYIDIVFTITNAEHYHVPLLLNAFGYSTYRGS